jgi:hypothetical protein
MRPSPEPQTRLSLGEGEQQQSDQHRARDDQMRAMPFLMLLGASSREAKKIM